MREVLAGQAREPLAVFSATLQQSGTGRDTSHILAVLKGGRLEAHLVSETELLARLDEVLQMLEAEAEPFDCLMNLHRLLYLCAQDHGVGVVLDGIDGDTLLMGPDPIYSQLWRQGHIQTALRETL